MLTTSQNFTIRLHESRLTGKIRAAERQVATIDNDYCGLPRIVRALQSSVSHREVPEIHRHLHTAMTKVLREDNTREALVACGGVDAVVGVLMLEEPWFRSSTVEGKSGSLKAWNICLRILTELTVQEGTMSSYLHQCFPMLLTRVLSLIHFSTTFENAVILAEHMMSAIGPMVVNDDGLWALTSVIERLNERSLALICRPLAILLNFSPVLHTPDVEDVFTQSFVQRARTVHALLDRNGRRFLTALQYNFTLEKLVKLFRYELPSSAISTQFGRTFALTIPMPPITTSPVTAGMPYFDTASAIESLIQYATQNALSLEDLASGGAVQMATGEGVGVFSADGGLESVAGSLGAYADQQDNDHFSMEWFFKCGQTLALEEDPSPPPRQVTQAVSPAERGELMSITTPLGDAFAGPFIEEALALSVVSCQSEVLYVLSTILGSRYYSEVWNLLQRASTLDVLAKLLPNVFTAQTEAPRPVTVQTESESESHSHLPETQRKIEFVRLVHEMWDARGITDAYRQCLAPNWSSTKRQIGATFVKRIVEFEEDPCVRNLLCYAVESYLRGTVLEDRATAQREIATTLIPHIVEHVCTTPKLHKPESLFSLLGEVIRFCKDAMICLEKALTARPSVLASFQSVVLSHPYDCNLFLRATLLTLYDTTVWSRYDARWALSGRCIQDTFADFISMVLVVRQTLQEHPAGSLQASELLSLLEKRAPRLCEDVHFEFDTEDALRRSWRQCDNIEATVQTLFPSVCAVVLPRCCKGIGRVLYNMALEVELRTADSPDCICVITTTLLYFVLHRGEEGGMRWLLDEMQQAHESEEGERVDPFLNLYEVVCLWVARYSTRSHDTLVYCTHLPMPYWREAVEELLGILPSYFDEQPSAKQSVPKHQPSFGTPLALTQAQK